MAVVAVVLGLLGMAIISTIVGPVVVFVFVLGGCVVLHAAGFNNKLGYIWSLLGSY